MWQLTHPSLPNIFSVFIVLFLTVVQVWQLTEVGATAMVETITHSCFVSRDTRVHRAGIHALTAIIKSCRHSGKRLLVKITELKLNSTLTEARSLADQVQQQLMNIAY